MATTDTPPPPPASRRPSDLLFGVLVVGLLVALSLAVLAIIQRNDALAQADARAAEAALTLTPLAEHEAAAATTRDALRAQVDALQSTLAAPTATAPPTATTEASPNPTDALAPLVTIEPTAPPVVRVDYQATAVYAVNIALEIESYAAMLEATGTADQRTLSALSLVSTALAAEREQVGGESAATLEAARTEIGRLRLVVTQAVGRAQTAEAVLTAQIDTPTP